MQNPKIEEIYENLLHENPNDVIRKQLMKMVGNLQSLLLSVEVLNDMLSKTPNNQEIIQKLLEIRHNTDNTYDILENYFKYWK